MKITDVKISNDIDVSFIYHTHQCREVALLRKKIMTKIYSYLIDQVTFNQIPKYITPEKLAIRFGLLIPLQEDKIGHLDVKGPKMVYCSDIEGMSFKYNMPIIYLDENETLKCTLKLKKDCGETHAKWNPVASLKFKECEEGFIFSFELTGMLSYEEIMNQLY